MELVQLSWCLMKSAVYVVVLILNVNRSKELPANVFIEPDGKSTKLPPPPVTRDPFHNT